MSTLSRIILSLDKLSLEELSALSHVVTLTISKQTPAKSPKKSSKDIRSKSTKQQTKTFSSSTINHNAQEKNFFLALYSALPTSRDEAPSDDYDNDSTSRHNNVTKEDLDRELDEYMGRTPLSHASDKLNIISVVNDLVDKTNDLREDIVSNTYNISDLYNEINKLYYNIHFYSSSY